MRFLENYFLDSDNHLIGAEDGGGLFVLFRHNADELHKELEGLRGSKKVKWFHHFSNQREGNAARGAREAVADFTRELRQRNLDLPANL
ncbi:MAG: hypothetical protein Greene071436_404, partial [Parcubacteria group bacterium Greene0714_36]